MKRTYDQEYLTRNPKARAQRTGRFLVKNRRGVAVAIVLVLIGLFVLSCFLTIGAAHLASAMAVATRQVKGAPGPAVQAPDIYANAAVLVDEDSGRVLYQKNPHARLAIASTTKMITALVVMDKAKLGDKVTISPEAAATGEQAINLTAGETLTVEQLMYALVVQSANDAAVALAQHVGGSVQGFADLMNKEAEKLGAKDSHFLNPNGLDQQGHYSSAYDLAIIGREFMKNPELRKMAITKKYDIPWPGHPYQREALNHNEILTQYPGATGIKTGYTANAGFCLVASANRNNTNLIASVLNSEHRANDAAALFNYGFKDTQRIVLVPGKTQLGKSRVSAYPRRYVTAVPEQEVSAVSVKGANDVFEVRVSVERKTAGSVKQGDKLGSVSYWMAKQPAISVKAIAASTVKDPGFFVAFFVFIWYALCWMGHILTFGLA